MGKKLEKKKSIEIISADVARRECNAARAIAFTPDILRFSSWVVLLKISA